jgi:hypothetical protein
MRGRGIATVIAFLTWTFLPAGAGEVETLRLGDLTLDYDKAQWRLVLSSAAEAVLEPSGALVGQQDPVRLVQRRGARDVTCGALAAEAWPGDHYAEPEATETDLAGRPALRLAVRTRCRNATPVGRIACIEKDGSVYAVMVVNAITGCRSVMSVLVPDPAPLDELIGTLRLRP